MKIILASGSPRRRELLDLLKVKYEIIKSSVDEKLIDNLKIEEQSKRLAYIKAKEVFEKTEGDRIVIGSDTLVVKQGKIYGKPQNNTEAFQMIKELKGDMHEVITSIAVLSEINEKYEEYIDYDIAKVYVKDITNNEIQKWIDSGNAIDKAGAYAIQGEFSVFIEKIEGNYQTIVGLPVGKVYDYLKKLNVIKIGENI